MNGRLMQRCARDEFCGQRYLFLIQKFHKILSRNADLVTDFDTADLARFDELICSVAPYAEKRH